MSSVRRTYVAEVCPLHANPLDDGMMIRVELVAGSRRHAKKLISRYMAREPFITKLNVVKTKRVA